MRVFISLLVFVAALFAPTEATVGTTAKLTNVAASEPISALHMQTNGQRFLRKGNDDDELDEVGSEERSFNIQKIVDKVKSLFSMDQRLVSQLEKNTVDDLLKNKKVGPDDYTNALNNLKAKGKISEEKFNKLLVASNNFDTAWYNKNAY